MLRFILRTFIFAKSRDFSRAHSQNGAGTFTHIAEHRSTGLACCLSKNRQCCLGQMRTQGLKRLCTHIQLVTQPANAQASIWTQVSVSAPSQSFVFHLDWFLLASKARQATVGKLERNKAREIQTAWAVL